TKRPMVVYPTQDRNRKYKSRFSSQSTIRNSAPSQFQNEPNLSFWSGWNLSASTTNLGFHA
ncbi:MAG TPA: hypothetical protein VE243_01145, partial [Candidatus Acidoferrum sp.]|nr:hypothetical protein [Candidatus Acidoferrum sp.]